MIAALPVAPAPPPLRRALRAAMSSFFGGEKKSTLDSLSDRLSGREPETSAISDLGNEISSLCPKMTYTQVRAAGEPSLPVYPDVYPRCAHPELKPACLPSTALQRFWGFGICVA
eukprot:SAG22_NODE_13574_length_402_cov_0.511551_1_plen_114_part_10